MKTLRPTNLIQLVARSAVMTILLLSMSAIASSEYGRLFSTPEQRGKLDQLRQQFDTSKLTRDKVTDYKKTKSDKEAPKQKTVSVKGIVTRSDGQTSIWVNQTQLDSTQQSRQGVVVRQLPDGGKAVLWSNTAAGGKDVKPGQTLILDTGQVMESYRLDNSTKSNSDAQDKR